MPVTDDQEPSAYSVSPDIRKRFDQLLTDPLVRDGLQFIESDAKPRLEEQIQLTEIPAPPFGEKERAEEFERRFEALGLSDVHIDAEGNALGTLKGSQGGPKLVVSAHLDTVFPKGYDARVTIDNQGIVHAPGISDDATGLHEHHFLYHNF